MEDKVKNEKINAQIVEQIADSVTFLLMVFPGLMMLLVFLFVQWVSNEYVFGAVMAFVGLLFSSLVRKEIIKAHMPLWQKKLSLVVAMCIFLFFTYIVAKLYIIV